MAELEKPFDVTKAVDLTDLQIAATWVDLSGGGFFELADPRSPMPLFLLGGKGSGRTHLMRYYSYPLQRLRAAPEGVAAGLRSDGYIGVYMRCEGLNAGRFDGKGQTAETWMDVFAYYMDLWLAELALLTVTDALGDTDPFKAAEADIAAAILELFDDRISDADTVRSVQHLCARLRKEVDFCVNNAALSRDMSSVRIHATRGRLVFGIPQILADRLDAIRGLTFVYLVDELENLTERQQMYLNTLVREKQLPCTFKVGSRLFGFRTRKTLSAGEDNHLGSEFEQILLDDHLRADKRYDDFARSLIAQRLRQAGYKIPELASAELRAWLSSLFEEIPVSRHERAATRFVEENYEPATRPYLVDLRKQLDQASLVDSAPGVHSSVDIERVLTGMQCPEFPLIEKLNIFLLYQDWSAERDLLLAADEIGSGCRDFISDRGSARHARALAHFKTDLLAQLFRRGRQPQRYFGLQVFIDMSCGLPRHLLIVLKFVHRWALFGGERAFDGTPISLSAQRSGVLQASNWFFEDAQATGTYGQDVRVAIERLARLMHDLRFADKPVESSLCTFSLNESVASEKARAVLRDAVNLSLLLRVPGGQKDRNDEGVVAKYQLSPMLCPRFDLPLARRGTVPLRANEVEAIFGDLPDFDGFLSDRLSSMNAPFRRTNRSKTDSTRGSQFVFPEME